MKTAQKNKSDHLSIAELGEILEAADAANARVRKHPGRYGSKSEAATHRAKYLAVFARHADPKVEMSKWVESCVKELRSKSLELKILPDSEDAQKQLFAKVANYRKLVRLFLDETPNQK